MYTYIPILNVYLLMRSGDRAETKSGRRRGIESKGFLGAPYFGAPSL